jgi:acetyltransferase-like isoleucine patch superfamily enzyme
MAAKPPAALLSAAFIYVRKGGTVAPLSPLYNGPYRVISSGPKIFKLQVGERVEVGANAVILGGIRLGDESIIGAGSVVLHDVPPRAVVAGNPARVLRINP